MKIWIISNHGITLFTYIIIRLILIYYIVFHVYAENAPLPDKKKFK